MFRWTLFVAAIGAVAVGVGIAAAANGVPGGGNGNTTAAQLCKNGGWQYLVRADQTPFLDQGECVSYASQGGIPGLPDPPPTDAQTACTAIGGTFGVPGTDVTGTFQGYPLIWTCNDWPYLLDASLLVPADWRALCVADGGDPLSITSNGATIRGISCFGAL